ncbi:cytoplasmic tRNA 2-thiolation protein 2-A-like isoform X1 [Littorina saxatilis]|uniref:Cytoplasmic tRNA 2-thiolation protein 2 n=1 Tax=Littorina saxatilis TaxID=31220 RepID=A0AAN9BY28_9CAEN
MCSVQEEAIPQQLNQLTGKLQCVKCRRDVPVVVTRVNDAFCQDCFLVYAVHKFRSAIGKSKVIVPKEHVLVAYSGGPASSALLHFLQEGKKEGKLRFTVTVVHIDELALVSVSDKERQEKVQEVVEIVQQRGFPLLLTSLECAMDMVKPEAGESSQAPEMCKEVTSEKEVDALANPDKGDKLKKLLDSLPSISAKEEFIRVLRNQVLLGVARERGFTKVVVGDTATALSVRIMTDMAKGKGSQVSFDTTIGDKRYGDVMVVRPIRDLNMKEVEAYNRLQNVESISIPHIADQWHKSNSIEQLTAHFIHGLQENFPSTVPNIVRTSDKLGHQDIESLPEKCSLCESPLDTDVGEASALRAVEVCERLLQKDGASRSQSQAAQSSDCTQHDRVAADNMKASLCYGCRLTVKGLRDVSLLPTHVVQKSQSRCLSRDEMRAQISEFLLDDENGDTPNS